MAVIGLNDPLVGAAGLMVEDVHVCSKRHAALYYSPCNKKDLIGSKCPLRCLLPSLSVKIFVTSIS